MSDASATQTHPTLNPLGMTSHEFVAAARGRIVIGRLGGTPGAMLAYKQVMRDGATRVLGRAGDAESGVVAEAVIPPIVKTHREESPEGEVIKFVTRLTVAKPVQAKDTTDEPMTPVSLDDGVAKRMSLPVLRPALSSLRWTSTRVSWDSKFLSVDSTCDCMAPIDSSVSVTFLSVLTMTFMFAS